MPWHLARIVFLYRSEHHVPLTSWCSVSCSACFRCAMLPVYIPVLLLHTRPCPTVGSCLQSRWASCSGICSALIPFVARCAQSWSSHSPGASLCISLQSYTCCWTHCQSLACPLVGTRCCKTPQWQVAAYHASAALAPSHVHTQSCCSLRLSLETASHRVTLAPASTSIGCCVNK